MAQVEVAHKDTQAAIRPNMKDTGTNVKDKSDRRLEQLIIKMQSKQSKRTKTAST